MRTLVCRMLLVASVMPLTACFSHRPPPLVDLASHCPLGESGWQVATLIDPEAFRAATALGQPASIDGSRWLHNAKGAWRWCVLVRRPSPGCRTGFQLITLQRTREGKYRSTGWLPGPSCLRPETG